LFEPAYPHTVTERKIKHSLVNRIKHTNNMKNMYIEEVQRQMLYIYKKKQSNLKDLARINMKQAVQA